MYRGAYDNIRNKQSIRKKAIDLLCAYNKRVNHFWSNDLWLSQFQLEVLLSIYYHFVTHDPRICNSGELKVQGICDIPGNQLTS